MKSENHPAAKPEPERESPMRPGTGTRPSGKTQPTLETQRLILRPFAPLDAGTVQRLAGDRAVADTTERIPHPYEDGMAEAWIATHPQRFQDRQECTFAVVLKETSELIGTLGLTLTMAHRRGELGYWIGRAFWSHGYCTEAAQVVVHYGFSVLGLHRIQGKRLTRNPASGRVMEKLGMRHEGRLRGHTRKWDVFEDVEVYGILCEAWSGTATSGTCCHG